MRPVVVAASVISSSVYLGCRWTTTPSKRFGWSERGKLEVGVLSRIGGQGLVRRICCDDRLVAAMMTLFCLVSLMVLIVAEGKLVSMYFRISVSWVSVAGRFFSMTGNWALVGFGAASSSVAGLGILSGGLSGVGLSRVRFRLTASA